MRGVLLKKTLRDMRRRLPQVIAIGVMAMLGVMLFVASYDSFRNVQASYERTYARMHFADLTVTGADPASVAAAVDHAAGVERVATRTQVDRPMTIGATKLVGRVVGIPPQAPPAINQIDLISGRLPDQTRDAEVVAERHTADAFALAAGTGVQVFDGTRWRNLTVTGAAQSPEYLWPARSRQDVVGDPHAFAVLFVPESLAETLAGRTGPNQTLVEMNSAATPFERDRVVDMLHSAGAMGIEGRGDQPSDASLRESLHGLSGMAIGFPALFLSAAAIAEFVLITRLVHTERRVIGTLLALGARRGAVVWHYVSYGAVIAVLSALAGIVAGAAITSGYTKLYASLLKLPDTVVEHRIPTAVLGLVLGLSAAVLAGLVPAVNAARSAPAQTMRGEIVRPVRPTGLVRSSAAGSFLPVAARMALRSLTRSRRRTAATMLGAVLAFVLILSSASMLTSVRAMLASEFGRIQRQDATVLVTPGANQIVTELNSIPGVAVVEPATSARVVVAANGRTYPTSLAGLQPATVLHGFFTPGGTTRTLPRDGVLAGAALADLLGVRVGDDITVTTATGALRRVRLAGLVDEPLGTALYATNATASSITNTAPNGFLLGFHQGADRDRLRAQITALTGVLAYTDAHAAERQIDSYLVIFWTFAGTMLALGAVLAFTVIYLTMSVNVAERTGELAILRAAGAPVGRLAAALTLENLTATMLAVPIGLAAGIGAGWLFLRSFNNDLFHLHLSIGAALVVVATVVVMAVAALSQLPAVRLINRMDVATAVRDREQ